MLRSGRMRVVVVILTLRSGEVSGINCITVNSAGLGALPLPFTFPPVVRCLVTLALDTNCILINFYSIILLAGWHVPTGFSSLAVSVQT